MLSLAPPAETRVDIAPAKKRTSHSALVIGGLTQPLFNAAIPASFRRGNIEVLIALQQLNMAMVDELYRARVSYYNGAYNRQLKQLTQDQRAHLAGNASAQQTRFRRVWLSAALTSEPRCKRASSIRRIEAADRAYQGAALSLADTMGDDLTGRFPLPQMESELKYSSVPVDVSSATTLALNRRADIKLARLMVKAAAEDERIMEAAYYPVVNGLLQGEYIPVSGVRRQSEGSVHRSDDIISSELREGAAYTWRVVDNGKVTGQVRQKRSAREINEILLKKMEADVPRDLARLQTSLDAIGKNYSSISQAIDSAQQSVVTVNQNVSGGVASQLESRLAENASLETENDSPESSLPTKLSPGGIGSRDRALFPILRRSLRRTCQKAALKLPATKNLIWAAIPIVVLATAIWYWMLPVAEVVNVRRGTAVSAVYGTVRIESAFVVHVRAQNAGFIHLAEAFSAGRGAIGKSVSKGDLLATIADEATARQLKQARAEVQSARERAALPLPSSELLKTAEDTLQRLEKLPPGNVPAADYQKAKSEAARLQSVVKTERNRARAEPGKPRRTRRKSWKRR